MKNNYPFPKQSSICIIFLISVFQLSLHSQGEWQWAKSYSGVTAMNTTDFNQIIRSGFDSYGDVYILGKMTDQATIDGYPILNSVTNWYRVGYFLAKFDPLGNMVWIRPLKSTGDYGRPLWMEIQHDRIHIFGNVDFPQATGSDYDGGKLYYFDTLVHYLDVAYLPEEEWELPFNPNLREMNCLVTFDLDGNIVNQNFIQLKTRGFMASLLCYGRSPFHIDQEGNAYIATEINFSQKIEEEPFILIVNNEKRYNFSLSSECIPTSHRVMSNGYIFKFSPEFDLLWLKPIVSHITCMVEENGNSYIDTVYDLISMTWLHNLTYDDEGNMYLTGFVTLTYTTTCDGRSVHYPIDIYLDSVHYLRMRDVSSRLCLPFIIKYDTSGNVLWCNQLYSTGAQMGYMPFYDVAASGDAVFVSGDGQDGDEWGGRYIYFDEEGSIRLKKAHENHEARAFCAKYDKVTGEYIEHEVIPGVTRTYSCKQLGIINNHVVLIADADIHPNYYIARFRDDCTLMTMDTIFTSAKTNGAPGGISVHESGYLFAYFHTKNSSVSSDFGSIHVPSSPPTSSAVFGLQYDPSLLIPYDYVGIPEYNPNNAITVYPNPVQTTMHIRIDDPAIQFKKAEIYGISGQKLGEYTTLEIPVGDLPAGIYVLQIQTNNNSYVQKFTKINH